MGEVLVLRKYQQLPALDQALVDDFIDLLLKKEKKRPPAQSERNGYLVR